MQAVIAPLLNAVQTAALETSTYKSKEGTYVRVV